MTAAPAHLTAAERAVWTETVSRVSGELTAARLTVLENYCVERARQVAAEQFLREHGDVLVLRNDRGEVTGSKPAPQLAIARSARSAAEKLEARLRLRADGAAAGNGHDARGRFTKGNVQAVGPLLYTDRDLLQLREEVGEFLQRSIADDGGEGEVSTRRRTLHEYRARVHRRIVGLDAALEARGLFDRRGKLRVAWITKLETLISTAKGIDSLLGLDRRAKAIPNLLQYLAEKAEATR
ncbi:MAG TPA: P27 family phage terminase small subunit [Vicinamibacterales bacterium]|nr:P27 family phage terminase small subunit [Vicinamibacterales bacterium]